MTSQDLTIDNSMRRHSDMQDRRSIMKVTAPDIMTPSVYNDGPLPEKINPIIF